MKMGYMNLTILAKTFLLLLAYFAKSEEVNKEILVQYCPKNIETNSEGYGSAVVTWKEPKFVGATGMARIRVFPNKLAGRPFPIGVTHVSYKALDDFENVAWCNFTVTIVEGVCHQPVASTGMHACLVVHGIAKVCASPCIKDTKHLENAVEYRSLKFCSNRGIWVDVKLNLMDKQREHLEGEAKEFCKKKFDLESKQEVIKENFISFLKMDTPFCWFEPEKRFCSPDHVKIITYLK